MKVTKKIWERLNQKVETDPKDVERGLHKYVWILEKLAIVGMVFGAFFFLVDKVGYATSFSKNELETIGYFNSPYISFYIFFFSSLLYIATRWENFKIEIEFSTLKKNYCGSL